MRFSTVSKLLTIAAAGRTAGAFAPSRSRAASVMTKRFMSGDGEMKHIRFEEMDALIDDYEELGREKSGVLVLDVRNTDEIEYTGKLSPNTITLPLPAIMQYKVFDLDEEEFEELCGFTKPSPDETLVFSCAAGIRSVHAAKFASDAGYSKLVNYMGGANEWFNKA
jgi:rhodanese-related sulfurtransferase